MSKSANYGCLNGLVLKIMAMVLMVIDHIGHVLYPHILMYRYLGRMSFPIFAFLLVEGVMHSKNKRGYAIRLLIFAIISEIPFDLANANVLFDWSHQNIFWTLLLGLLMLWIIRNMRYNPMLEFALLAATMVIAFLAKTDYNWTGILLIYTLYKFREKNPLRLLTYAVVFLLIYVQLEGYLPIQYFLFWLFSMIGYVPIFLYNGQRGFANRAGIYTEHPSGVKAAILKYWFYAFYPVHLIILFLIRLEVIY